MMDVNAFFKLALERFLLTVGILAAIIFIGIIALIIYENWMDSKTHERVKRWWNK